MVTTPTNPREYTQNQTAKRLGVSVTQVKRYREEGRLTGEERDGAVYYARDEVDALAEELAMRNGGVTAVLPRLMEHIETLHKSRQSVSDDYKAQITVYQAENDKLRSRCDQLENKHLEVLRTFEDLQTQRHKREIERMQVEADTGFKRTVVEKVSLLAPAIVNRLAGRQLVPTEDTRMLALEALAETITEQQFAGIRASVSNEQAAVLADLIDVAKQNARARASKSSGPAGTPAKGPEAAQSTPSGDDGQGAAGVAS